MWQVCGIFQNILDPSGVPVKPVDRASDHFIDRKAKNFFNIPFKFSQGFNGFIVGVHESEFGIGK